MNRAFTLIELLIVVAIIAILAAIAVPNFLEAQVRSKVSRAKSDIRSLATAIEAYRVDFNRVPLCGAPQWALSITGKDGGYLYAQGVENRSFDLPVTITTPISYITAVPKDAFGTGMDPADLYAQMGDYAVNYWYFTKSWFDNASNGAWAGNWRVSSTVRSCDVKPYRDPGDPLGSATWVIISKGPDKFWAKVSANEVDCPQMWAYEASNGTISIGNIFRCD